MLEIGSLVDGKYKVLSKVGQGGMSVVYMAINEKANKTWAIKEVRKDGVLDFEAVKQGLVAETDILKKLSHPNLPSIIDVIDTADSFIIIMDYIQGNSLSSALSEYGAQPQEYVIEWAKQLCDVLGYLHSREPAIIYRDMKPANIMLKPDGNVTLIDFGTAREFKEKNLADTTCLGTVGYAAPEQFGGMGQTDARTDIYCLGATLYHLVTGCNPSEPPYEIKPIREINPGLSSGLERIINKCTQRNPEDRYQSAAELMYALEHYEEIDDLYRKKQKKKLSLFIACVVMSVILAINGFAINSIAKSKATDTYKTQCDLASNSEMKYDDRINIYQECIALPNKGGEKEAYLGLVDAFKMVDEVSPIPVFNKEEKELLDSLMTNHEDEIKKNLEDYAEINFEIGKLYWYYYDSGSDLSNAMYARTAFKKVASALKELEKTTGKLSSEQVRNLNMATAYASIGDFYANVDTNIQEGNEAGIFKETFKNFENLISTIAADQNEVEIVRLNLIDFTLYTMIKYTGNLKNDGVTQQQIQGLHQQIEKTLSDIIPSSNITQNLKQKADNNLKKADKSIDIYYSEIKTGGM